MSLAQARMDTATGAGTLARVLANVLRPRTLALVACVVIAGWLVFVPLAALFYTAFTEDTGFGPGPASLRNFIDAYSSWHILRLFGNSLVFAIGTAVATLLMGALVAFVVERTDAPLGPLFHSLALLSFAIPGLLTSMAWIFVLSPNIGWVNALLKSWFGLTEAPLSIYSMGGMIWALSSHYFPLAYLMLGPTLRVLDVRLEEAALVSGAKYWQVLPRITLPLLRPAILSTLVLLFMLGMSSYEVPRLIGRPARIDVFTTEIQAAAQNAPPEFGTASALGMTLLFICVIAVFLVRQATRNAEAYATITGKGYMPTRIKLRKWRWPVALGVLALFVVALGLPLLTLVWQSFFRNLAQPFIGSTSPFTWENYEFILHYPIFVDAVKTSVFLAAMSATLVVALTFVMAWIALRAIPRSGWVLEFARLHADRDAARAGRRSRAVRLSDAADPGLQYDLDPAHRLRVALSALRHALHLERAHADPQGAGGGGGGLRRPHPAGVPVDPSAAACAGAARGLDLYFRAGGARARRLGVPDRPRHACARHDLLDDVGRGRQLRRGLGAGRDPDRPADHHCCRPALA